MMLYMEEGTNGDSGGCENGAKCYELYMMEGADGNSGGSEDVANIMMLYMEKRPEENSDGCEDKVNYSGYKLYVVITNFHVYVLHLVI